MSQGLYNLMDAVVCEFYGISQEKLESITDFSSNKGLQVEFNQILEWALENNISKRQEGLDFIESLYK